MSKEDKLIVDIYKKLYKSATPKADFEQLVKDAKVNKYGQKEIDFNSYVISREDYNEILNNSIPKSVSKIKRRQIETTIALGCSPRFN